MPLYTNTSAKIPRSYSQGLPKNLMEYSAKVYDRFLNNHQHIIKEMEYRQKLSSTVKKIITAKHRGVYGNVGPGSFMLFGSTNGAEIETNDGSTGTDNAHFSTGFVYTQILPNTAVIGKKYDEVANDHTTSTGNIHLGVYDDSSGTANNLLGDTGEFAQAVNYTYHTFTEFTVPTTQLWTAVIVSFLGGTTYKTQAAGSEKFMVQTYGALPTPFVNDAGSTTANPRCKIAHTWL